MNSDVPGGYAIPPLQRRLREEARTRGALPVARELLGWGGHFVAGSLAARSRPRRRLFELAGRRYPYLVHPYNFTWMHERAVEVPVARAVLDDHAARGARILEVGNVLSHYGPIAHDVVDKYERRPGVRNVDVLDLDPAERYDLVVSVSTLEHVGVDDSPHDPRRAVTALERLREMVAPGGQLFVTIPLGYNLPLVESVRTGGLPDVRAMIRDGAGMRWSEVDPGVVWATGYDRLLYRARAVLMCGLAP